jgi:mevalonate kinase
VYGYPSIVTAVNKRLFVEADISEKQEDEIIAPQVKESRFVLETIEAFKDLHKITRFIKISTKGDFSHRVGLGSSSAVTVATFGALNELFKTNMSLKDIFAHSYKVSLSVQGVGSGFDIAAATFGKTLWYIKGGKDLKVLTDIELPLVVGYSGIKADTPYFIRKVAHMKKYEKNKFNQLFSKIGSVTRKAALVIKKSDYKQLGELMNQNHSLLQKLGVSIPKLDNMVSAALSAGAYGAKLSGAGGGDCIIALVSPNKKKSVEKSIKSVGGEIIDVTNSVEGLRTEL